MGKLEGKVALITGASKGIGRGISTVFAQEGARLVLAARGDDVIQLAEELKEQGYDAIGVRCDVSNKQDCENLIQTTLDTYGKLDVLDCNAGICHLMSFLESDDEWVQSHININIMGVWNVVRAALPHMVAQGKGSVVITSSVTGDLVADPGEVAYATTKAALIGFTKALAREVADKNIRVNCICPGCIETPLLRGMAVTTDPENPQAVLDGIATAIPMGRLGTPEECGKLCAFLASDEASYLTGTQINIDGGSILPETVSFSY